MDEKHLPCYGIDCPVGQEYHCHNKPFVVWILIEEKIKADNSFCMRHILKPFGNSSVHAFAKFSPSNKDEIYDYTKSKVKIFWSTILEKHNISGSCFLCFYMCVILKHIFMCLLFLPVTKIFKLFLDLNYYTTQRICYTFSR